MISLDTLRSALFSPDPYADIDRLVRAELDAGRTTRQIFDELQNQLASARSTPGLTEDGEEAILGVMDALIGNCHIECQYHDRPQTILPSEANSRKSARVSSPFLPVEIPGPAEKEAR